MRQNRIQHKFNPMMRLTAEKKKAAMASLLIGVMIFMWARLLIKKNDASAEDSVAANQAASAEVARPKIKITYVELPQIKGRTDLLSRDFFASSSWQRLGTAAIGKIQTNQNVKDSNEDFKNTIETIGKELKLEAVFSGKNPQASVSGMLVSPQGKLTVKYEGEIYEFKALALSDNEVVLECKGIQVKLSMIKPNDSAN